MKAKHYLFITLAVVTMFNIRAWALDNDRIVDGLKEALNVGINEAVKIVGAEDGYYKNSVIKILLPEKLEKADKTIRSLGGEEISETLVLKMNRAAEKAAPGALDIFVNAVKEMKIDDAMKVLSGENNAATAYLKEHTSDALVKAFYPIVKSTMEEVNTLKTYNEYVGKLKSDSLGEVGSLLKSTGLTKSGPLAEIADIELDINQYVTEKAIGGLFKTLAEQEEKIRLDPKARVTDLLKDVFGKIIK